MDSNHLQREITNELFSKFSNSFSGIQTIKVDDFMSDGLADYDFYISDHRPIGMKVKIIPTTSSLIEHSRPKINIFPNPTDGHSSIDLSQFKGEVEVTISDLNGTVIKSMQYHGNQLVEFNFDCLAGLYLLSAKSNNDIFVLKWIKKMTIFQQNLNCIKTQLSQTVGSRLKKNNHENSTSSLHNISFDRNKRVYPDRAKALRY